MFQNMFHKKIISSVSCMLNLTCWTWAQLSDWLLWPNLALHGLAHAQTSRGFGDLPWSVNQW